MLEQTLTYLILEGLVSVENRNINLHVSNMCLELFRAGS